MINNNPPHNVFKPGYVEKLFKKTGSSFTVPANYMIDGRTIVILAIGNTKEPSNVIFSWANKPLFAVFVDGKWGAEIIVQTRKNGREGLLRVDATIGLVKFRPIKVAMDLEADAEVSLAAKGITNLTVETLLW